MLNFVKLGRAYNPETIAVMTAAFDKACHLLSTRDCDDENARQTLALAILRQVDQGECDPERISELVSSELAGLNLPTK
jgi:hypothetical protein